MITANPTIDFGTRFPALIYLDDGVVKGRCVGNPEGLVAANAGSELTDLTGVRYRKTTDLVATGWVVDTGGGGGAGTVTSVDLTMPSIFSVSGNPVTTSGTLAVALANQNANRVFAGPASGVPAVPTFRALTVADLAASAAPPAGGVQFNDGTNGFTAETDFLFDSATGTLQLGVAGTRAGRAQWRGAVSGSVTLTVDQPSSAHVVTMANALPTLNDLLTASAVSGNNVTWGWTSRASIAASLVNPTSGVFPYNNAGVFADSPLTRTSSSVVTMAGQYSYSNTQTGSFGDNNGRGLTVNAGTLRYGFSVAGAWEIGNGQNLYQFGSGSIGLATGQFTFGSPAQNPDIGFARRQAGYVRATNGSTGVGGLLLGGSADTPIGLLHVNSQSAGVEAAYFTMPTSPSVPMVRGVISSIQSWGLMGSGKIVGGANVPTANQQFSARGNLQIDVSELGNIGAGATNLLSKSIIANSVANTNDAVHFRTVLKYAANANNKQVEVKFATQSIFLISDAFNDSPGFLDIDIYRTSSTTAKVVSRYLSSDALLKSDAQYFELTGLNWANSQTLQVIGTATSNNDIINKLLESNITVAL